MGGVKAQSGESGKRTRRKWSEAQKIQIVQESQRAGTVMLEVCRRHGLHPSLLTKWRAQHRDGTGIAQGEVASGARLLPVHVQRSPVAAREVWPAVTVESAARSTAIEVEFSCGRRLCIRGAVDAALLRTVLQELSQP